MLKFSNTIKLVATDFDGVFTDCNFYIDENLNQQKKMNFKDIMGVSLLLKQGINVAIISGESTDILNYFNKQFGLNEIHGLVRQKGIVLKEIMEKYKLKADEVLYIGDDINDIPAFECVKYRVAPNNANEIIKTMPYMQITEKNGGEGAFREMVDALLKGFLNV